MIRALDDWHEHAKTFADAFPVNGRPPYYRPIVGDDAKGYLNSGFYDWVAEDANDQIIKLGDRPNMIQLGEAIKKAERPVRVTLAIHPQGDGIAHQGRRRSTLMRLKKHVWFVDDIECKDEMLRNIQRGMPAELVAAIYPVCQNWAVVLSKRHGFKLEGVR